MRMRMRGDALLLFGLVVVVVVAPSERLPPLSAATLRCLSQQGDPLLTCTLPGRAVDVASCTCVRMASVCRRLFDGAVLRISARDGQLSCGAPPSFCATTCPGDAAIDTATCACRAVSSSTSTPTECGGGGVWWFDFPHGAASPLHFACLAAPAMI
jgi:hypothetical protein